MVKTYKSKEELIARLILNTKRTKRPDSIVQIADDIIQLKEKLGSLDVVGDTIGISKHMLNQFLGINKLSTKVFELVKQRELDSVSVAYYLGKHSTNDQLKLALEYIDGKINSQDLRGLGPLRSKYPDQSIEFLIEKTLRSKNIKVSVVYFQLHDFNSIAELKGRFVKLIGDDEFVSIENKGLLGILKITAKGEKKLRSEATILKLTFKDYINNLVKKR